MCVLGGVMQWLCQVAVGAGLLGGAGFEGDFLH
jgi:hypothetical protein